MIQMYTYLSSQVAEERRREMLANAQQERLALQARAPRRAARSAGRPARLIRQALRAAAGLRTRVPA